MILVVFGPDKEQQRFARELSNVLFDVHFNLGVMPHDLVSHQARFLREAGAGNICLLGFVEGTKVSDVRQDLANWSDLITIRIVHLHVDEHTV